VELYPELILEFGPIANTNRQQPDLTCTLDWTKGNPHRQVVGVENAGRKAYGKATGLYNEHWMYSEQWNLWHPFWSTHNIQQAQSFNQQTKTWIDQHLRRRLDNYKMESFQSEDTLRKLLSELDFGPGDDCLIEDDSHIFEHYTTGIFPNLFISYYRSTHFRHTLISNWCALLTLRVVESTVR
jgi:hypothetical protein